MFGSDEPPPLINMKPKVNKLMMKINPIYLFF